MAPLKALVVLAATLIVGCGYEAPRPGFSGDFDQDPVAEDHRADAIDACLLDKPVCVQAVYCDERSSEEWEVCNGIADGSCKTYDVPAGEECLGEGFIGRCDGHGACR